MSSFNRTDSEDSEFLKTRTGEAYFVKALRWGLRGGVGLYMGLNVLLSCDQSAFAQPARETAIPPVTLLRFEGEKILLPAKLCPQILAGHSEVVHQLEEDLRTQITRQYEDLRTRWAANDPTLRLRVIAGGILPVGPVPNIGPLWPYAEPPFFPASLPPGISQPPNLLPEIAEQCESYICNAPPDPWQSCLDGICEPACQEIAVTPEVTIATASPEVIVSGGAGVGATVAAVTVTAVAFFTAGQATYAIINGLTLDELIAYDIQGLCALDVLHLMDLFDWIFHRNYRTCGFSNF